MAGIGRKLRDILYVPVARSTMTLVSVESTILAWMLDRAVFHAPRLAKPVHALEDRIGLNRDRFDDVVIDKYSHMGRPKHKGLLAATMLPATVLALPTLALGQLSYLVFKMGLGKRFANPQGAKESRAFLKTVKLNHSANRGPATLSFSPRDLVKRMDPEYQLERYVDPNGSDFNPTPAIRSRQGYWRTRNIQIPMRVQRTAPGSPEATQEQLAQEKIKHVVIIMQENHTFDDYFGKLFSEGPTGTGAAPGETPEPMKIGGETVYPADDPPKYLFAWWPTHGNWSYRYQKFMAVHEYHDPSLTPVTTYFAKNYAAFRHFHEFQRGPSHVNHLVQIAATAGGLLDNFHSGIVRWIRRDPVRPPLDVETITHRLEYSGKTWGNYGNGVLSYGIKDLKNSPNNLPVSQFVADATHGKLRHVSYIVPPHFSLNEHSPDTVRDGQQWLNDMVQSVVEGGNWEDTAFLILYDDWGGYKQHNPPPLTMRWKDELPNAPDPEREYGFGDEVAAMVVSPYAKPGYLFHKQEIEPGAYRSFASVPAFLETIFGLDPLTQHDAAADNLLDAFDFTQQPLPPPPVSIDEPTAPTSSATAPTRTAVSEPAVEVTGKRESPRTSKPRVVNTPARSVESSGIE